MTSSGDANWIEQLADPLPEALRGKLWSRVEQDRSGRWLALAQEGEGEGTCWYRLRSSGRLQPLSIVDDSKLAQGGQLVGEWLRLPSSQRTVRVSKNYD